MQIHELNQFSGTPGAGDWIAIDDGDETTKIEILAAAQAIADMEISSKIKNQIWYGTSSNAASTTAKTATCPGFILKTGETIAVKFSNTNTVAAPTLNVNGTGAKSIRKTASSTDSVSDMWDAGGVVIFVYDGSSWVIASTTKTPTVKNTVSISASTGTLASSSCITIGKICFLTIQVSRNVDVRQGYNIFVGNLQNQALRPVESSSALFLTGTSAALARMSSSGDIRVMVMGADIPANTANELTFAYRIA